MHTDAFYEILEPKPIVVIIVVNVSHLCCNWKRRKSAKWCQCSGILANTNFVVQALGTELRCKGNVGHLSLLVVHQNQSNISRFPRIYNS